MPKAILDRRVIQVHGKLVPQALVQWSDLPIEDASWESIADLSVDFPDFSLEDKATLDEGGNDTTMGHEGAAGGLTDPIPQMSRPKRQVKLPAKFADYV